MTHDRFRENFYTIGREILKKQLAYDEKNVIVM